LLKAEIGYILPDGTIGMKLSDSENSKVTRLRAHHICCVPFFIESDEDRGPGYRQIESKIQSMFLSPADSKEMVIEGGDELCQECPLFIDGRCASLRGSEEAVRKWDTIVLKELGLTFNTCLTCRQWHDLIEKKVPFKICQKCQWKKNCSIGSGLI